MDVGRGVGLGDGVGLGGLGVAVAVGGAVGATVGAWVTATWVGTSVGSGSEERHATAATASPDITQTAIADDRYVLELRKGRRCLMCMNRRRLSYGIGCSYGHIGIVSPVLQSTI